MNIIHPGEKGHLISGDPRGVDLQLRLLTPHSPFVTASSRWNDGSELAPTAITDKLAG